MIKTFFAMVLALIFLSCKENTPPEPPPYVRSIELEALDASCTEAWLKVTLTHTTTDSILLTRDGQRVQTLRLTTTDSLLIDEGLLPRRSYTYKAYRFTGTTVTDSSQTVQVTTMDTTSHNFTWQIDTLGDGSSSVLYDVAIINDTLAYAVGEIWKKDSNGNWINPPYNIAKWNGQQWELMRRLYDCRLYFPNCGPNYYLYTPIRSIFAFGPNDIWMAAGTAQHWDGVRWTEHAGILGVGDANKIWGTSSNNLYFVGNNGFIAHYDGTSWRRIESGTKVSINDVWGRKDVSETEVVLAGASDLQLQGEMKLLKISPTQPVQNLDWSPQRRINTLWFWTTRKIYVGGSGLYEGIPGQWQRVNITNSFIRRIRGTFVNNVWAAGDFGFLGHFNGATWQKYSQAYLPNGSYYGLTVTHNMTVAVGQVGDKAVILRGRKNNFLSFPTSRWER